MWYCCFQGEWGAGWDVISWCYAITVAQGPEESTFFVSDITTQILLPLRRLCHDGINQNQQRNLRVGFSLTIHKSVLVKLPSPCIPLPCASLTFIHTCCSSALQLHKCNSIVAGLTTVSSWPLINSDFNMVSPEFNRRDKETI